MDKALYFADIDFGSKISLLASNVFWPKRSMSLHVINFIIVLLNVSILFVFRGLYISLVGSVNILNG